MINMSELENMKRKFNSQICTTREQSERLLSLGLKKETADMVHSTIVVLDNLVDLISEHPWTARQEVTNDWYPAWSLHRLIEIAGDDTGTIAIRYEGVTFNKDIYFYSHPTTYDNLIDCIEWLIKEDALKKQYLEE